MTNLRIDPERLWGDLMETAAIGGTAKGGICRLTLTDLDRQVAARQQEVQGINADQGRLRENMKALKGSAEEKALLLRYTRALNREEDRLNVLGEEITQLKKKREAAGKALDQLVMGVNLDQTF